MSSCAWRSSRSSRLSTSGSSAPSQPTTPTRSSRRPLGERRSPEPSCVHSAWPDRRPTIPRSTSELDLGAVRSVASPAARNQAVDGEQDQRANDGNDDRAQIHAGDPTTTEQAEHEPADQRAGDSDQHGHDDAARVTSRHDQLGEDAGNQSENDPRDYAHTLPYSVRRRQTSTFELALCGDLACLP